MWISPFRPKKETYYLFKFESWEDDFLPYIKHLRSIALHIKEKANRLDFLDLVDTLYERSGDEYLKQSDEVVLSYFDSNEMAEFTVHLSYLLLEVKE